ncbi:low molecular weight protein-tyrosine-phosphatase [Pedobacter nutrimenti]|uniref:protein-tyrosine-phosphatase n=1 Tax=Pedobacter nutrimenti TaxID=1241337 RepID=A0A318UBM4_9SPHI|nr:low molecular weight protein-tyrosine-phosphatase [Pedobacter nutrimenti]PYF72820.1 protein-tyrosine phosphatase [Pedobacter nutrimenti]
MKILMVCLGNICRSPLAHGILQHMADQKGLNWEIDSAGTGNWHVGQQPDKRSVKVARSHHIDISNQRAQHFNAGLFDAFDRIYVMDKNNLRDVLQQARTDAEREKVQLFLPGAEVPDPYWEDDQFEPVFCLIEERCRTIVEQASV